MSALQQFAKRMIERAQCHYECLRCGATSPRVGCVVAGIPRKAAAHRFTTVAIICYEDCFKL